MRFGLFLILILISSCAQVGVLTGGPEDAWAPVPDSSRTRPINGSTNYSGKEISIPFNEFIQLNNPTETMIVIPPNIKPKATSKGKSLQIKWEEETLPNTTYAFYLNGTVTDITEKNDSLYTFVFSTGNQLDSLKYSVVVKDAITSEPSNKVLVGLWQAYSDSVKPMYIAQTNSSGLAQFNYLKTGVYEVLAFEDKNRNLLHDLDETFGFSSSTLQLDSSIADSIPIRLSPVLKKEGLSTVKYNPPNSVWLGASSSFIVSEIEINDEKVLDFNNFLSQDSAILYLPKIDTTVITLKVTTPMFEATEKLRLIGRNKFTPTKVYTSLKENWKTGDLLGVYGSSRLEEFDTSLIQMRYFNDKDSGFVDWKAEFKFNQLYFQFPSKTAKKTALTFLPGALTWEDKTSNEDTLVYQFNTLQTKDLGNIAVKLAGFSGPVVVELLQGKEVIENKSSNNNLPLEFTRLLPGEYTFRVLLDENENFIWDKGNWPEKKQPEKYIYFNEKQKVRANWDLELELKYVP
ncbi:MAG: Ig-like domain-containing protein [Bacteroidetes bacterium]|nr:Ig-like domain-containing protein [Bacteroidota bacterium]